MNWETLTENAPWRTPAERQAAQGFTADMRALLDERGAALTPFLFMLLRYALDNYLITLRLEAYLDPSFENGVAGKGPNLIVIIDAIGRSWARTRKAFRELEEYCGASAAPKAYNLAEIMQPIMERTKGILERVLVDDPPADDEPGAPLQGPREAMNAPGSYAEFRRKYYPQEFAEPIEPSPEAATDPAERAPRQAPSLGAPAEAIRGGDDAPGRSPPA